MNKIDQFEKTDKGWAVESKRGFMIEVSSDVVIMALLDQVNKLTEEVSTLNMINNLEE